MSELERIRQEDSGVSVGIITPHTNQQKMISDWLGKLPEGEAYLRDLKLKVMTFDTCQGDERDIIFYSMVATETADKLRYIFVNDLKEVDLETEKRIRVQRLNVGFSRSRECMYFVLSKPTEQFQGAVGQALRHYVKAKADALEEKQVSEVDTRSQMEPKVLTWFYQTEFWKENKEFTEINPQFEIGKYLKQLDPRYEYPKYKVDFLLVHSDNEGVEHKIVIEYDGFREHFEKDAPISRDNFELYMSEDDIYRQKVLEGYGYKFLRINKFNVGSNPIETLDKRIMATIKGLDTKNNPTDTYLNDLEQTVKGLQEGSMKECPKCGEVKENGKFYDPKLVNNYGRICNECKGKKPTRTRKPRKETHSSGSSPPCPECGRQMVIRKGPYGRFFGCSGYPYCKGIRNIRK